VELSESFVGRARHSEVATRRSENVAAELNLFARMSAILTSSATAEALSPTRAPVLVPRKHRNSQIPGTLSRLTPTAPAGSKGGRLTFLSAILPSGLATPLASTHMGLPELDHAA